MECICKICGTEYSDNQSNPDNSIRCRNCGSYLTVSHVRSNNNIIDAKLLALLFKIEIVLIIVAITTYKIRPDIITKLLDNFGVIVFGYILLSLIPTLLIFKKTKKIEGLKKLFFRSAVISVLYAPSIAIGAGILILPALVQLYIFIFNQGSSANSRLHIAIAVSCILITFILAFIVSYIYELRRKPKA